MKLSELRECAAFVVERDELLQRAALVRAGSVCAMLETVATYSELRSTIRHTVAGALEAAAEAVAAQLRQHRVEIDERRQRPPGSHHEPI